MRRATLPLLLAPLVLISCGSSPRDPLQPALRDAASGDSGKPPTDAGVFDAETDNDASLSDAGAPEDAGPPADVGPAPDSGDAPGDSGQPMADVTFTEDVWPVFEASGCGRVECHGSLLVAGGSALMLSSPELALLDLQRDAVTSSRRLVVPGMPQASELFVHGRDANIPAGDLTVTGLGIIEQWIAQCAVPGPALTSPVPPEPATCDIAGRPGHQPLPQACLPRCTADTREATIACRTASDPAACQSAVFAADTTPATTVSIGTESAQIGCGFCLQWQTLSCYFDACPVETLARLRCPDVEPSSDGCATVRTALDACVSTSNASACQATRDAACFQ